MRLGAVRVRGELRCGLGGTEGGSESAPAGRSAAHTSASTCREFADAATATSASHPTAAPFVNEGKDEEELGENSALPQA